MSISELIKRVGPRFIQVLVEVNYSNINRAKFLYFLVTFDDR